MPAETPNDPQVIALQALAATLSDERRADRFLAMTGIGTEELRRRLGEPALLAAVLDFLEAHEPDLVDVANALDIDPMQIVDARRALEP